MISADALTLSEAAALVARATIVLSLTWLGARVAMRRSASTRHAVWAAGFIAALALPFAARAVPALVAGRVAGCSGRARSRPRLTSIVAHAAGEPDALPSINVRDAAHRKPALDAHGRSGGEQLAGRFDDDGLGTAGVGRHRPGVAAALRRQPGGGLRVDAARRGRQRRTLARRAGCDDGGPRARRTIRVS